MLSVSDNPAFWHLGNRWFALWTGCVSDFPMGAFHKKHLIPCEFHSVPGNVRVVPDYFYLVPENVYLVPENLDFESHFGL